MEFLTSLKEYVRESEYVAHETKKSALLRFLLVVGVVLAYLVYISLQYGTDEGIWITLVTWAFFVFCTPIADAGFLLDFPLRIITNIKMVYSEMAVWFLALMITVDALLFNPQIFEQTVVLKLFHHILVKPFPYWLIILVSAIGTFVSVHFGDELVDVAKHEHREKHKKHKGKYRVIIIAFVILLVILLYDFLLIELGIDIPFL